MSKPLSADVIKRLQYDEAVILKLRQPTACVDISSFDLFKLLDGGAVFAAYGFSSRVVLMRAGFVIVDHVNSEVFC